MDKIATEHDQILKSLGLIVAVDEKEQSKVPTAFALDQNYPNPFNAETTISYSLPHAGHVKILIYNTNGQLIAVIVDKYQTAGYHSVKWVADDFVSGIYFYRMEAHGYQATRKALLLQ